MFDARYGHQTYLIIHSFNFSLLFLTSLLTMNAEEQQKFPLYSGKQKADLIKRYIDASNKFLLKNKKKRFLIKPTFGRYFYTQIKRINRLMIRISRIM